MFLILLFIVQAHTCTVMNSEAARKYPDPDTYNYLINFNETTMQANYVSYVSTSGGNSVRRRYFKVDPYGINILRNEDYTNTGFDRGHLVPNADYGNSTFIISNAVPMSPIFNSGVWYKSEAYIRQKYAGHMIFKGCDYDFKRYTITSRNNILYIPVGCYYVVYGTHELTGQIIDYGYISMEGNNVTADVKQIPWWVHCKPEDSHVGEIIGIIVAIFAAIWVFVAIVAIAILYKKYIYRMGPRMPLFTDYDL